MGFKTCSVCGRSKDIRMFFVDNKRPDGRMSKCKACSKEYQDRYRLRNKQKIKERRRRFLTEQRLKAIEYKGGKCVRCGYSNLDYLRVFQFHHINPKDKKVVFSFASNTFESYKVELDKCILLCANCHMAVHDGADYEGIN